MASNYEVNGTHNNLDFASDRITAIQQSGNDYITDLESIRTNLGGGNAAEVTLGAMVGAQLDMTETETKYMVRSGMPKKASTTNNQAAQEVKKAAG